MALRWLLTLSLLSSLVLPVTAAKAQTLDQYGGYTSLPAPGGATGFFRLEKVGARWVFVTPLGNQFWMRSVQVVNTQDAGQAYADAIYKKYNGDRTLWATQTVRRLQSWGFNAIGEYAAEGSFNVLPVGTYNSPGLSVKVPFIRLIRPSTYAWGSVHDLVYGTDPAVYTGWRGKFYDVYDSKWATNVALWASDREGGATIEFTDPGGIATPWLIGTSVDDTDFVGFLKSYNHPHLGWLAAVTAPTKSDGPNGVTYSDPTVYTKLKWRDYLIGKYGTIGALNSAWGSSYTTFNSDGGWPYGRGVLDESGRNAWMATTDFYGLSNLPAAIVADLNQLLENLADQYFGTTADAVRAANPNHLVFSPDAMDTWNRPEVFRALGRHYDAVMMFAAPSNVARIIPAYNIIQKPLFFWQTMLAQADSPYSAYPGYGEGYDAPTQAQRGAQYATAINTFLALQGSDGSYPIVGIDWWEWADKQTGGEHSNFGLVTALDNAYDGKEATIAAGTDPWGYATGGEAQNYGDFLSSVKAANAGVAGALGAGTGGGGATTMTVAVAAPQTGTTVSQSVTVSALASSTASRLSLLLDASTVAVFGGTTASYLWDTTTSPNGTHTWTAKAYDASGNSVNSAPVSVAVQNSIGGSDTTAPVTAITEPVSGGAVARKTKVSITATATDNVGVTRVDIYVNGKLQCSDASTPYVCVWQVPAAIGKTYRIQAKAYDLTGNVGSSPVVTVTAK